MLLRVRVRSASPLNAFIAPIVHTYAQACGGGGGGASAVTRYTRTPAHSHTRHFSRTTPRASGGARVHLVHLGRRNTKDSSLDDAVAVYTTRMRGALTVEERWVKGTDEVLKLGRKMPVFALERDGWMPPDSVALSEWVYTNLQLGGSRMALVIGDENGVPKQLLEKLPPESKISLGPLTLTHKIARLVIVEQLYRALQIRRGTKYHK